MSSGWLVWSLLINLSGNLIDGYRVRGGGCYVNVVCGQDDVQNIFYPSGTIRQHCGCDL